MTDDDPFLQPGETDRTVVVRPTPGGRRPGGALPPTGPGPAQAQARAPRAGDPTPVGAPSAAAAADNPLVACAADLLAVAGQLRGSPAHPDPQGLRERLIQQVRDFESCARGQGLDDRSVLPARYVLCALLDESVLDTPWGSQSVWSERGLLIGFHNEAWGGEKFYEALERLLAFPSGNLHLLELMYLCLAMGFEGRYRVLEDGRAQLERVRDRLYQTVRAQRPPPEAELSPHWRGLSPQRDPLIHQLPLWVFSGLAGLLLLGLFAAYTFALSRDSDPVYAALANLDQGLARVTAHRGSPVARAAAPAPEGTPAAPAQTLRTLLADQIPARLEVQDRPLGETLIVRGDGLFASARATLNPAFEPLIRRIGEALKALPGKVVVTGHSDSTPIRSLRFPDNWSLSKARAETVAALLIGIAGQPERFAVEGRGATEPLIPSDPRDPRNRRVEIALLSPPPQGAPAR